MGLTPANWISIFAIATPIVLSFLAGLIFLGFRTGTLLNSVKTINDSINEIKGSVNELRGPISHIPALEDRIDILWQDKFSSRNSPLILNDNGKEILEQSVIKKIIDERYGEILESIKELKPANAYEAQEGIRKTIEKLSHVPEIKSELEICAFKTGVDVFVHLYVGTLYIRDRILKDLNISSNDH